MMNRVKIPSIFNQRQKSKIATFEESFIFRISRAVPLSLAAIASVVAGVSFLLLLYSIIPPRAVREPEPAVIPPEVTLSLQDVEAHLRSRATIYNGPVPVSADTSVASAATAQNPSFLALARKVHAIRTLLPHAWEDRFETYCASSFFGYCTQTGRRQTAEGVSPYVMAALDIYDTGDDREWIYVQEAGQSYELNVTDADRKLKAITELEGILKAVPAGRRKDLLTGWTTLRRERENDRLARIGAENNRVSSARAAEEARFAAAQVKRGALRSMSLSGIGSAIAGLWLLGLTLALLAIERNTRALRVTMLGSHGARGGAPSAGTETSREASINA
jgi:hypothetical protein